MPVLESFSLSLHQRAVCTSSTLHTVLDSVQRACTVSSLEFKLPIYSAYSSGHIRGESLPAKTLRVSQQKRSELPAVLPRPTLIWFGLTVVHHIFSFSTKPQILFFVLLPPQLFFVSLTIHCVPVVILGLSSGAFHYLLALHRPLRLAACLPYPLFAIRRCHCLFIITIITKLNHFLYPKITTLSLLNLLAMPAHRHSGSQTRPDKLT